MGISSDGQICYGVILKDNQEFPWDRRNDNLDGNMYYDFEDWWFKGILGFRNSFELFELDGSFIGGKDPGNEVKNKYFEEYSTFKAAHGGKPPLELVTHCSYDYPMLILAIPGTYFTSARGRPKLIDMEKLSTLVKTEDSEKLLKFCAKFKIEYSGVPSWILSSLLG